MGTPSCLSSKTGPYGYHRVNVADQRTDADSLLNWMRRLIAARKDAKEVGLGDPTVVDQGEDQVLVLAYTENGATLYACTNLADSDVTVNLGPQEGIASRDVFADANYDRFDPGSGDVTLRPFGYRWFRTSRRPERAF